MSKNQREKGPWQPTPWERLVSVPLWLINAAVFIPCSLLFVVIYRTFGAARVDWLSRFYVRLQMLLIGVRWSAQVDPAVDPNTPYLFVQNHVNHFDVIACYNATPHFKQGIELAEHFNWPFYGWFMKARGTIGVVKGKAGDAILPRMREELAAGHSLLVFPEGSRTLDGHTKRFRRGAFYLAADLGVPIVPVCVKGSYAFMRKGSLVMRPFKKVKVTVMKPIPTQGLSHEEMDEVRLRVRAMIDRELAATD